MGKNPHPPRKSGLSKKSAPPDDGLNIIFTNDDTDKKSRSRGTGETASSSQPNAKDSSVDDAPKKPSAREIIGGQSWTGKLPVNLLSEHCQKQKWERPDYTMHKSPEGYSSSVILKSKNPKTQEITALDPLRPPASMKELATQPSALEARHFAAAYGLFRICSMRNIHMMMPPSYREIWKGDFEAQKKEDVASGKAYMYEADPFLAAREKQEAQAQMAKQREQRAREAAARVEQPGGALTRSRELPKGWRIAQKVEMGPKMRKDVEAVIRNHDVWNHYQIRISEHDRSAIVKELSELGFRRSHVEEATSICKDREEVLEWLLIHVPEDDLPSWSLPENYAAGISFASSNLKREGALKRLSVGGYAPEICEEVYDRSSQNERNAAQGLQDTLLGTSIDTGADGEDGANDLLVNEWDEEQTVLASIYESKKYEKLGPDSCRVYLELEKVRGVAYADFTRPWRTYPQYPPILTLTAQLPAYIRLSITKQALQHAASTLTGVQMIFSIVDWIEHEAQVIVENPGKLSDISNVATATSSNDETGPNSLRVKRTKRHPQPIKWMAGTEASMRMSADRQAKLNTPAQLRMMRGRQSLPAWTLQEEIVTAVNTHQVVIISGETGSGKSTQSVQFVLDDMIQRHLGSFTNIVCTQPRRISALGLADRVADERCSTVGQEIGYAIRGESKQTVGVTKITFVTTGVLLRRMQTSGGSTADVVAALADISHVVVDEVHERSLDTDFLLVLLRDVLKQRKDLKVILMSATLDANVFERYFGGPSVVGRVEIQGRTFPVEDRYIDDIVRMTGFGKQHSHAQDDEVDDVAGALKGLGFAINYDLIAGLVQRIDAELGNEPGGILIFLPGTMEIQRMIDALKHNPKYHALPLHASLLSVEQRRVFPPAPAGKRKVIAATNVAETSITIEDVVAVIDSGKVKETRYDPFTSMVKLEEVWASRAACKQRRGRAGRVRAGICYKMYTRNAEAKMAERPDPEIRRVPLEQLCLSVKAMGTTDVAAFLAGTLTPPETLAIEGAMHLLRRMGALDADQLTPLGRHMSMIPADLRCAKLMVHGALFGLLEPCVTIAAILTVKSPFVSPQTKREESKTARMSFSLGQGDIIADLRAYEEWVELRSTWSPREVRSWCDTNFLSFQTLNDIASTRTQYTSSLQEIGFLPYNYRSTSQTQPQQSNISWPVLHSLVLSALYPQTLRITLPPQKYTSTSTGTLAVDPESKEIKHFDDSGTRMFIHPSSTLFAAQSFPNNAGFLSYFNKVETSKVFVRELSPCGAFGLLLFGGPISLDTQGRGLIVDGWVRLRGWARIGVLVGRLRGVLEGIMERWVERPGTVLEEVRSETGWEKGVVEVAKRLVELQGLDR